MICPYCFETTETKPLHYCRLGYAPPIEDWYTAMAELRSYGRCTWRLRLWYTKRMGWRMWRKRHWYQSPIVEENDRALSRRIKQALGLA